MPHDGDPARTEEEEARRDPLQQCVSDPFEKLAAKQRQAVPLGQGE
jgi:hypothetical protein